MKNQLKRIIPVFTISLLFSCGGLTESQAETKLKAEAERLSAIACDCISKVSGLEGDAEFEAKIDCRGTGQSELYNFSHQEGIDDDYPKVNEEILEHYIQLVDKCLD